MKHKSSLDMLKTLNESTYTLSFVTGMTSRLESSRGDPKLQEDSPLVFVHWRSLIDSSNGALQFKIITD